MKVSDLIEILEQFDPHLEVFTSQDPEGNGFSPVDEILTVDLVDSNYDRYDEDDPDIDPTDPEYIRVVTIWPV